MKNHTALIEWESNGLSDIPTVNLVEFTKEIKEEINNRDEGHELNWQNMDSFIKDMRKDKIIAPGGQGAPGGPGTSVNAGHNERVDQERIDLYEKHKKQGEFNLLLSSCALALSLFAFGLFLGKFLT